VRPTERYLQQATRGLWGKEKRALRTELHGHILERIEEFRLGGLGIEEAERQVLRELGAPGEVRHGMLSVHTLPAIGKASMISLMLASFLLVWPQTSAQVNGVYHRLPDGGTAAFVDLQQLKTTLETLGGTVDDPVDKVTVTVAGAPRAFSLPIVGWGGATLIQNQRTYLNTDVLLTALQNSGVDLKLSGWNTVTVQAGRTAIDIRTQDPRVNSRLYQSTLLASSSALTTWSQVPLRYEFFNTVQRPVDFTGVFQKDAVYAMIVPTFVSWYAPRAAGTSKSGTVMLTSTIHQAEQGHIRFQLAETRQPFKLFPSVQAFKAALRPYLKENALRHWDRRHPAPALLLKLSGHFGSDAFMVVDPGAVQGHFP